MVKAKYKNEIIMRKWLLVLMVVISSSIYAQKTYESERTSAPEGRYEIVQSSIRRSCTFKLDKYTGKVSMLVKTSDDRVVWQKMEREESFFDTKEENKINYQIFMGSHAAADCFLVNVNTGKTWMLVEDKNGYQFWQNMLDE